jgi:hypothetical protein
MPEMSYFSAWRPKSPGALSRRKKRIAAPAPPVPATTTTSDVAVIERPLGVESVVPDRTTRRPVR